MFDKNKDEWMELQLEFYTPAQIDARRAKLLAKHYAAIAREEAKANAKKSATSKTKAPSNGNGHTAVTKPKTTRTRKALTPA